MDNSRFLAHRAADGREETVRRHLEETSELAGRFAAEFGAGEQGRLVGMAHDIGKYSEAFQRRLNGSSVRVDHSTAGAFECAKLKQDFSAFAVAGHHSGLPDLGSRGDNTDLPTFWGRMNRAKKGLLEPYGLWRSSVTLPAAAMPDFLARPGAGYKDAVFFTRMLYSCLVDADFLATEAFMSGRGRETVPVDMAELEDKLSAYINNWFPPKGEINELRCEILKRCIDEGRTSPPGVFTMTVPTGGGKTVSSMAFALAHANANGLKRIVYVIPYTSIIEQNAKVFRDILGNESVLEHHSGAVCDMEREADPHTVGLAKAAENWDMPVIVTTAVQFFESLFSNRSSKCRKLHNLARSVIIFDEVQMLPVSYLRPCVYAIAQLIEHYGTSAVLCTATQPALEPLFREFLPGAKAVELCPGAVFESPAFHRVTFTRAGKLSWDELAMRLSENKQVLCVVNSRWGAKEVFERMKGEGRFHLSTLMYPKHREKTLEKIRERLNKGLDCRVVSTSLIEAGVDVDFPAVYREQAGLDSVLQAAGRCNREGRRSPADSVVTVFQVEDELPKLFAIPIGAGRAVMKRFENIASREAVTAYFTELLALKMPDAQDEKGILPLIEREKFPFKEIANRFHLIENNEITVYIPFGEGEGLVEQLRGGCRSRALFRRLGRYGVSVYARQSALLKSAGALEILEDGSAVLLNLKLYDKETGLDFEGDDAIGFFI